MAYTVSIGDVLALIDLLLKILKAVSSTDAAKEVKSSFNFVNCLNVALKLISLDTQRAFQRTSSELHFPPAILTSALINIRS
jgi:hypothetical protein